MAVTVASMIPAWLPRRDRRLGDGSVLGERPLAQLLGPHVVPGRHLVARPTSAIELQKTLVLRLPIEEGSAKVRAGVVPRRGSHVTQG